MGGGVIVASAESAALMAAVHRDCFGDEAWSAASITELFGTVMVFGFVVEPGGMVLARAVADEAEILTIGVVPAARRRGVARRLLGLAFDEARRRGARAVYLEVAAGNAVAVALYRALRFEDCGRRRDYYGAGADALLLRRSLCE